MDRKPVEPSDLERWQSIVDVFRPETRKLESTVTPIVVTHAPDDAIIGNEEFQARLRRIDEILAS